MFSASPHLPPINFDKIFGNTRVHSKWEKIVLCPANVEEICPTCSLTPKLEYTAHSENTQEYTYTL